MLADEDILSLAPRISFQPRETRYLGDAVHIDVKQIPPKDLERLKTVYDFLSMLYAQLIAPVSSHHIEVEPVRQYLQKADYRGVFNQINRLGAELDPQTATPELRKVYHDVRAGSLSALIMHADFLVAGEGGAADVERLFLLSRDHLKIMRNGIPDIDPEGYQRDLEEQRHGIALFREKWDGADYQLFDQAAPVHVEFRCDIDGAVSECCMEFAALDRVIYNLVNNASRFAADARVLVSIIPLDNNTDTNLRFVVANRISEAQRETLKTRFGGDMGQLFQGGFTTDGHGLGMRICGDVVTHGYDLFSVDEALEGGYMGARILHDCFVVWFHWPGHVDQA